jgi:hypothetical protein
MKTEDVFPSRFVKAENLEKDVLCTIEKTVLEDVYDQQAKEEVRKPVIYFKGAHKGLLLNKTNWQMLADFYGDESDSWIDKKCILTTVEVQAFGDVVKAIRIKIPKAA